MLLATYAIPVTYKHTKNMEPWLSYKQLWFCVDKHRPSHSSIALVQPSDRQTRSWEDILIKPQSYKNRLLVASYHTIMFSLCEFACLWLKRMIWQCKRKCNIQVVKFQFRINSEYCCNSTFLIVQTVCNLLDRAVILFACYLRSNISMDTYHETHEMDETNGAYFYLEHGH